jgi:hypothetical protein
MFFGITDLVIGKDYYNDLLMKLGKGVNMVKK